MSTSLHRRLLNDLKEFRENPYPGITLHVHDEDITTACLVIQTGPYGLLHMSVSFDGYPIEAPRVKMNSIIDHPNVFHEYICASVLNDDEGYTSAYTLMGIALQILSFFNADAVEQDWGGTVDMVRFRQRITRNPSPTYYCTKCLFGGYGYAPPAMNPVAPSSSGAANSSSTAKSKSAKITQLPAEVILNICENLETKDIISFGDACPKVFAVSSDNDIIRIREMICFCLKQGYRDTMLGVGVSVPDKGNTRALESEFDLLSYEAFHIHRIRRSVQGVPFRYWLPLPISPGHWTKINYAVESKNSGIKAASHVETSSETKTISKTKTKSYVETSLEALAKAANLGVVKSEQVLIHMMNDVAVKLNKDIDATPPQTPEDAFFWLMAGHVIPPQSALTHASEKAIESYFHLFHFLLCMATADPQIVTNANKTLDDFCVRSLVSKEDCKNLGHLLVASLLSSDPMTVDVKRKIVGEAITRNVVWALNKKPALAYVEPSAESTWRLKETFMATLASYRILMFQNLFREHAVPQPSPQQDEEQAVPQTALEKIESALKKLATLRDQAFERHGAPPSGVAQTLAAGIKKIHQVETFSEFFKEMGIPQPDKANFTNFLRNCIRNSEAKGYHRAVLTQPQALYIRLADEPDVERGTVAPLQLWGNIPNFHLSSGTGRGGYRGGPSVHRGGGGRGGGDHGRGRGGRGRGRGGNYRGRGGQ